MPGEWAGRELARVVRRFRAVLVGAMGSREIAELDRVLERAERAHGTAVEGGEASPAPRGDALVPAVKGGADARD